MLVFLALLAVILVVLGYLWLRNSKEARAAAAALEKVAVRQAKDAVTKPAKKS